MIPKTIHYCWFGGKPIPEEYKAYMDSWRKYLPDYLAFADKMEDASIDNILDSVLSEFEYIKYNSNMKILFMHGTKGNESVSAKCAVKMKQVNPQTEIKCFNGYAHAQLACFEQRDWIRHCISFFE